MKAAAGWQPDIYDDDDDDAVSSLCAGYVEGQEHYEPKYIVNAPHWPPVAASITSGTSSEWHDAEGSKRDLSRIILEAFESESMSESEREIETQRVLKESSDGNEKPRWPSVVRGEYHTRMDEMWRKCGERLGRKLNGGPWWV